MEAFAIFFLDPYTDSEQKCSDASYFPYSLTCLTGHLCPTVTLRPAQLILLYNLTLFNGHLSNTANGHLFHA